METDGSGETKQTLLLLPLPLLFLVRLLRRFLVGEKKGKGINRAKRISSPLLRPAPPLYLASGYRLSRYRIKE